MKRLRFDELSEREQKLMIGREKDSDYIRTRLESVQTRGTQSRRNVALIPNVHNLLEFNLQMWKILKKCTHQNKTITHQRLTRGLSKH